MDEIIFSLRIKNQGVMGLRLDVKGDGIPCWKVKTVALEKGWWPWGQILLNFIIIFLLKSWVISDSKWQLGCLNSLI